MISEHIITGILPEKGLSGKEILTQIEKLQKDDIDWIHGKVWSLVYFLGDEHQELLKKAFDKYFSANYLNPFAFESLKKMEYEVIKMTAEILHADEDVTGTMSSGGTESILLAMYTYREWAKKHHPHIKEPEVVAPLTIHPAFDKAAHLFGLKLRKAEVDSGQEADVGQMEKLINKNTILLAASAPSYANGILDPIPEIGALALNYQLPFHVDSCIGGFMLPWIEQLGYPIPNWDFRVEGVSSISADVHKFGFGAKGASVILYRNMNYLKHQFFITTDFPGGIYISPTILGTRPGGPIAAAWASMKHLGKSGYLKIAKKLIESKIKLESEINAIPELQVIGKPCMNILSYTTKRNKPDIFAIGNYLEKAGWMVDRQQHPDCIHLTILPTNSPVINTYLEDLTKAIEFAKKYPSAAGEGNAAIYGIMARIPFRGMVKKNVRHIFEEMYNFKTNSYAGEDRESITKTSGWTGKISRILSVGKRWFSSN